MPRKSSVVVVGGGMVGATAALALAQQGFTVTLVDRQRPVVTTGALGIDVRNVALSPASQNLLDGVGLWSQVQVAPYRSMCVWEQWGGGQVQFDAADVHREELGWLVEVSPLLDAAWQALEADSNCHIVLDSIEDVVPGAEQVSVQFAGQQNGQAGQTRQFDFLIAADGAQSVVRRALNMAVVEHPLDQVALATVVRTSGSHQQQAWQRFLTEGPLAFLPSPDEHVCSIVWSQTANSAERRVAMEDAAFCVEIEHAIEHRLGEVTAVDRRFVFPLSQQRLKSCAPHNRVLLIGDAMRVVHPLAGLGVNLGLEDVTALLEVAQKQDDLSNPGIWGRFARQRQVRSQMMIQVLALLQNLYSNTNPTMSLLRNFGVASFNSMEGLKRQVMREAMGLGQLTR